MRRPLAAGPAWRAWGVRAEAAASVPQAEVAACVAAAVEVASEVAAGEAAVAAVAGVGPIFG